MNEPRGGTDGKSIQRQTSVTSPRSPVKLEDYANIRRPTRQQSQNQEQGRFKSRYIHSVFHMGNLWSSAIRARALSNRVFSLNFWWGGEWYFGDELSFPFGDEAKRGGDKYQRHPQIGGTHFDQLLLTLIFESNHNVNKLQRTGLIGLVMSIVVN